MNLLPKWVLPPTLPSVYDLESFTALEMVAKLYGAINELIGEYNNTVKQLDGFKTGEQAAREEFEQKITKVLKQFTCEIERQFTNLETTAGTIINEAIQDGRILVKEVYDPETESLYTVIGGEV